MGSHAPKELGKLLEVGNDKEMDCSLEPPEVADLPTP